MTDFALPPSPRPSCSLCGAPSIVQWQRRPTDAELAAHIAAEEARRERALLLADQEQPPPAFGPLPTAADTTTAVFACALHAIDLELAAHVHGAGCNAPDPAALPRCDCTPEPHPEPDPLPRMDTLATGWKVPAP